MANRVGGKRMKYGGFIPVYPFIRNIFVIIGVSLFFNHLMNWFSERRMNNEVMTEEEYISKYYPDDEDQRG